MFARWPGEFIQAFITVTTSGWPYATFSEMRVQPTYPARAILVARLDPSDPVWDMVRRFAWSWEWFWAARLSGPHNPTAPNPALARCALMRESISCCQPAGGDHAGAAGGAGVDVHAPRSTLRVQATPRAKVLVRVISVSG